MKNCGPTLMVSFVTLEMKNGVFVNEIDLKIILEIHLLVFHPQFEGELTFVREGARGQN